MLPAQDIKTQPTAPSTTDTNDDLPVEPSPDIVYYNGTYGFTLKFPKTWEGHTTKNRSLNWDMIGVTNSVDIGFPDQDSLFNIGIFTKDQWQKLQSEEGPKPTKIGENSQYVFTYERAQFSANDLMTERMKEIPNIISTFVAGK